MRVRKQVKASPKQNGAVKASYLPIKSVYQPEPRQLSTDQIAISKRQLSTDQIAGIKRNARSHRAQEEDRHSSHTRSHATIGLRSWHTINPRSTCFVPGKATSIPDGLEGLIGIRGLGAEMLAAASYALRPNFQKLVHFLPSDRGRESLSSVFYTSAGKNVIH